MQYYTDTRILFKIPSTCFQPPPKVMSCFVHVRLTKTPILATPLDEKLFKIIRTAFQQRRKTILNALSGYFSKEELQKICSSARINLQARPENLRLEDYVTLAQAVNKKCKN